MVDQGGTSTILNIHYEKEELEGKSSETRAVWLGKIRPALPLRDHVHVPTLSFWLSDPVGEKHLTSLASCSLVLKKKGEM